MADNIISPEVTMHTDLYKDGIDKITRNIKSMDKLALSAPYLENPNSTRVAIIGGGPTLKDDVGDGITRLQDLDNESGIIKIVTGSAHRLLDNGSLKNGADISIFNLPGAIYADVIDRPHEGTQYWLATQVDPAVIAKIDGADIYVWDAYVPEIDFSNRKGPVIGSGSTAPTAAIAVLLNMGVKEFDFYGVDGGSFESLPNEYVAYDISEILAKIPQTILDEHILVEVDGKKMKVATNFWSQAEEVMMLKEAHPEANFNFHGDSLNNMIFNRGREVTVIHDPRDNDNKPATRVPSIY